MGTNDDDEFLEADYECELPPDFLRLEHQVTKNFILGVEVTQWMEQNNWAFKANTIRSIFTDGDFCSGIEEYLDVGQVKN